MEETFYAKNWSGFYEGLKEEYNNLEKERSLSKEPYKQLELEKKMVLTNRLMYLYVEYLKTIGEDHGSKFLKTIEAQYHEYKKIADFQTDEKHKEIFNKTANLAVIKLREFKLFIEKKM